MPLKIGLYIGSWPQNIGNAFFDLGAKAIMKLAYPDADFYPMGGAVHWMFNASQRINERSFVSKIKNFNNVKSENINSFEIGQIAEVDLIVFAGMSMCREFAENNGRTFIEASKRGVAILGLGAGASLYTEEDTKPFSRFFNSLERAAILTRDDDTFNIFNGDINNIESGIDCAFFLPDYYQPPKLSTPSYDIENFDTNNIPKNIDHSGREVLYTHHDLWGPLPTHYINKPNTLVSDVPEDYLTLYSQVNVTHSDRVHACLASLAYGNKARLYSNTPRKSLFNKVNLSDICNKVCSIDMDNLLKLKNDQINLTRKLIDTILT